MIKILSDSCIIVFMKTIYIHAGPEKTGSTTIQSFLKSNRKELIRQNYEYESLNYFLR